MVAHLCCSVDAGYFLKKLQELYPDEKIIGYFYDPNIHPYSEFKLRSLDTERICKKLGIEYIEGDYDYEGWLKAVKGLENEPEKGARCSVCFDFSLEDTARFAKKIGDTKITTSLLMSPMKSHEQLQAISRVVKKKYDIDFLIVDFRKKGGTQKQQEFAKESKMYRQNYCGCIYGITAQKQEQEIITELMSPYPFTILPNSIEERLATYTKRLSLEKQNIDYEIVKENFLNYRLLKSVVKRKDKIIPHYTLFYSHLERKVRGRIDKIIDFVGYFNRMQIIFIDIDRVNAALFPDRDYKSVADIYKNPLKIEEEIDIRNQITHSSHNLSPIIIVDELFKESVEVEIESKIFMDKFDKILLKKDFDV